MKKRVKKLQLSKESVNRLDLGEAVVGGISVLQFSGCYDCVSNVPTNCFTDRRQCTNTCPNSVTCASSVC